MKEELPEKFKAYDKDKLDRILKDSNELYATNRAFVLPGIIKIQDNFFNKYKISQE